MSVRKVQHQVELPVVDTLTHELVLDPMMAFEYCSGTPLAVLMTGHMRAIDAARCLLVMPHTVYKWYDEGLVRGYTHGHIHRVVEVAALVAHVGYHQWSRTPIGRVWAAREKAPEGGTENP